MFCYCCIKLFSMKNYAYFLLAILAVSLSSCEVVGGIFKAGVWVGILAVAAVAGLIIFLFSRGRGRE